MNYNTNSSKSIIEYFEYLNFLIPDFNDYHSGKHHVGCQATVKVQLSNGTYHEDIGYSRVNDSSKVLAIEKARLVIKYILY